MVERNHDAAPVHERCTQHPFTCKEIADMQEEHLRMWTAIGKGMSAKLMLTILALLGAAYLTLFSVSIKMNAGAIDQIRESRETTNQQISSLVSAQSDLMVGIAALKVTADRNKSDIQECKDVIHHFKRGGISSGEEEE